MKNTNDNHNGKGWWGWVLPGRNVKQTAPLENRQQLKTLNTELPYDPGIVLLDINPKELKMCFYKDWYMIIRGT
jgi:hypothetical protein